MKNTFTRTIVLFSATLALMGAGCFQAKPDTVFVAQPPAPAQEPEPAPTPEPPPAPTDGQPQASVQLGEEFTLKIGASRDVEGGPRLTLEAVGDSRCKPNVQCIWAGELSPKVLVEMPGTKKSEEVTFGTTTKRQADALGYGIALSGATETTATLTVSK